MAAGIGSQWGTVTQHIAVDPKLVILIYYQYAIYCRRRHSGGSVSSTDASSLTSRQKLQDPPPREGADALVRTAGCSATWRSPHPARQAQPPGARPEAAFVAVASTMAGAMTPSVTVAVSGPGRYSQGAARPGKPRSSRKSSEKLTPGGAATAPAMRRMASSDSGRPSLLELTTPTGRKARRAAIAAAAAAGGGGEAPGTEHMLQGTASWQSGGRTGSRGVPATLKQQTKSISLRRPRASAARSKVLWPSQKPERPSSITTRYIPEEPGSRRPGSPTARKSSAPKSSTRSCDGSSATAAARGGSPGLGGAAHPATGALTTNSSAPSAAPCARRPGETRAQGRARNRVALPESGFQAPSPEVKATRRPTRPPARLAARPSSAPASSPALAPPHTLTRPPPAAIWGRGREGTRGRAGGREDDAAPRRAAPASAPPAAAGRRRSGRRGTPRGAADRQPRPRWKPLRPN